LRASPFRWLLVPELALGTAGLLLALVRGGDAIDYRLSPSILLAASGLTLLFAAVNFGLFYLGRRLAVAPAVYSFLEKDIFPLVREATLGELLLGAAMAGFSEELLFRGLLQPLVGLVAASLVFGLLHGPSRGLWPLALWAAGAGAFLGVLQIEAENLMLPTLVHAFYDALALLYVRYFWHPRDEREGSPLAQER
jgi:membrane protease YdiL (CAAX protease family)